MTSYDPTDLQAQEQESQENAEQRKVDRDLEVSDFKWIAGNKRGRRFLHRLLSQCGVWRTSFTGNSTTFFNEGQRNIGLMVLALMNEHAPESHTLMLQEHKAAKHERRTERPSDH